MSLRPRGGAGLGVRGVQVLGRGASTERACGPLQVKFTRLDESKDLRGQIAKERRVPRLLPLAPRLSTAAMRRCP